MARGKSAYTYAAIVFHYDNSQTVKVRNVRDIKLHYEDSNDLHYKPQHKDDFSSQSTYYAKTYCPKKCEAPHHHDRYRRARIIALGVSRVDAQNRGSRVRISKLPRALYSSSPEVHPKPSQSRKRKTEENDVDSSSAAKKKSPPVLARSPLDDDSDEENVSPNTKHDMPESSPHLQPAHYPSITEACTHAAVVFLRSPKTLKVRNVLLVKEELDDQHHIIPTSRVDFDQTRTYYAKSYCPPAGCPLKHSHDPYLPVWIVALGTSRENAELEATTIGYSPSAKSMSSPAASEMRTHRDETPRGSKSNQRRSQIISHERLDHPLTRVHVFTHAALEFHHDPGTLKVRPVLLIKMDMDDRDGEHMVPQHRADFDKDRTYYVASYCPEDCVMKHNHDSYRPVRIIALGMSPTDAEREAQKCGYVPNAPGSPARSLVKTQQHKTLKQLKKLQEASRKSQCRDILQQNTSGTATPPASTPLDDVSNETAEDESPDVASPRSSLASENNRLHDFSDREESPVPRRTSKKFTGRKPPKPTGYMVRKLRMLTIAAQSHLGDDHGDEGGKRFEDRPENKMYLGCGVIIDKGTWAYELRRKRNLFFNTMMTYLWPNDGLKLRSLQPSKLKHKHFENQPIEEIEPEKLQLLYSLYNYHQYHTEKVVDDKLRSLRLRVSTGMITWRIRDSRRPPEE